jgi:hypothetical protein
MVGANSLRRQEVMQSMYLNVSEESLNMKSKFGWIKVNGVKYEKDIILHADGSITKRQKKKSKDLKQIYGHTPLSDRELDFLQQENPKVVYIGIGHQSALPITPEAMVILEKFETIILPTNEITEKIDNENRKMVALIHVTC